jgi:hypothetical protein
VGWFAGHGDRSGVKLVNECLGVNDVQLTVVCLYRIQRDVVDSLDQENIVRDRLHRGKGKQQGSTS